MNEKIKNDENNQRHINAILEDFNHKLDIIYGYVKVIPQIAKDLHEINEKVSLMNKKLSSVDLLV